MFLWNIFSFSSINRNFNSIALYNVKVFKAILDEFNASLLKKTVNFLTDPNISNGICSLKKETKKEMRTEQTQQDQTTTVEVRPEERKEEEATITTIPPFNN